MCGGGRSAPPPPPPRMAPAPMLKTPRPVRDVPKPEDIADYTDDPNFITGKKRTRLSAETIRKGTKVFDALDPGSNPGTPEQGVPSITPTEK